MNEEFFNDPEFQELIKEYLVYLKKLVVEIENGFENKDYALVRKLGHNIKGSGGGYGFSELTEIGRIIEMGGKDQDNEQIRSGLIELREFLSKY